MVTVQAIRGVCVCVCVGGGKGEKWRRKRGKRKSVLILHLGLLIHSDSVLFILYLEGTGFLTLLGLVRMVTQPHSQVLSSHVEMTLGTRPTLTHITPLLFILCLEGAGYLTTAEKKEMDEKREEECKMANSFIRTPFMQIIFPLAVLRRMGEEILKTLKITKPGEKKGSGLPSKPADTLNKPVPCGVLLACLILLNLVSVFYLL